MSSQFAQNDDDKWKKAFYHGRSAFAVLLSLAVLIGMGFFGYKAVHDAYRNYKSADDYLGPGTEQIVVTVPSGSSVNDIGYLLYDADVIKSTKAWRKAVQKLPTDAQFQAGRYKVARHIPASEAVAIFSNPQNIIKVRVTLPEALRATDQFALVNKAVPQISVASLNQQLQNPKNLGLPAWSGNKAEGFLFPNTYEVGDHPSAESLMKQQVAQFTKVSDELNFEDRAKAMGYTPMQVLTMASIAEKEVKTEAELKMVVGVLMNRLKKNMPLQLDSTVIYANNIHGKLTTDDAHRQLDSPYNTYKHAGLPPGPIANPGRTALSAALSPTLSDYLYFVVTDPSKGTTAFSKTLDEHNKNVAKFQAWCQAHTGTC